MTPCATSVRPAPSRQDLCGVVRDGTPRHHLTEAKIDHHRATRKLQKSAARVPQTPLLLLDRPFPSRILAPCRTNTDWHSGSAAGARHPRAEHRANGSRQPRLLPVRGRGWCRGLLPAPGRGGGSVARTRPRRRRPRRSCRGGAAASGAGRRPPPYRRAVSQPSGASHPGLRSDLPRPQVGVSGVGAVGSGSRRFGCRRARRGGGRCDRLPRTRRRVHPPRRRWCRAGAG